MTLRDIVLAVLTSVIWGLAFVATRFGLEGFSALQLTAVRFLIAATPVVFIVRPAVSWRLLILIGLTLFTGQFLLLFLAFEHGMPPGLASVTQQTHVFLTVLLASLGTSSLKRSSNTATRSPSSARWVAGTLL